MGISPLVPKGTAFALSFSAVLVPAASWAERIAQRYTGGLIGNAGNTLHGEAGSARVALSFPWVFPRAWYLQDIAARTKGVPRWARRASLFDVDGDDGPDASLQMPVVAPAGGVGAAPPDESVKTWAASYERTKAHRDIQADAVTRVEAVAQSDDAGAMADVMPARWRPQALALISADVPASVSHLAWSDALLTRMVRGDEPSDVWERAATPVQALRSPELAVVRPLSRTALGVAKDAPVAAAVSAATPKFSAEEEVSDDVFAAIARPVAANAANATNALAAAPASAMSAVPTTTDKAAVVDTFASTTPASPFAHAASMTARLGDVLWANNETPVGFSVRLADAVPVRTAPQLFGSGDVSRTALAPAPFAVDGRREQQVATTPAVFAGGRGANAGDAPRVALPAPAMPLVAANTNRASQTSYLPGVRGFAAAAQAAAVAASVSGLALEFMTPQEAQAARAMQLAPTAWTAGVKLAAAGETAVAARWADIEQMALVSPSSPSPLRSSQASATLPRGVYQWPPSVMERWQQADLAQAQADGGGDTSALYQAFGAVWSETMVRQRLAQPATNGDNNNSDARQRSSASVAAAPALRVDNAPGMMPVNANAALADAKQELARYAQSAELPERQRPLGGRLDADALDYRVAIANGRSATRRDGHTARGDEDVATRVMADVAHGIAKDALPPAVAAWVAQFESAVANEQQLISVAPEVLAEAVAATSMRSTPFAGPMVGGMSNRLRADEARADHAAEVAALTSSYVVPKSVGGASVRQELSRLHPQEMAALLQASASMQMNAPGTSFASNVMGGDSATMASSLSESSMASVMAGLAPVLAGEATTAEPSLYEMTMIAALGQSAPEALAARTTNELVPPEPTPGPSPAAPIDIEAEAQSVLREVLHLIAALRDRNGEF